MLEIPHESASLALFDMLADKATAADSELPSTGVSLERERMLSAACIVSPTYGTRASTVLSATREIAGVTICMDEHTRASTGEVVGRERAIFAVTA